jgi:sporulation protein YlmC with PRC-barrel domain
MNADMLKKMKSGLLTASAVGVLLAAQGTVAADDQHKDQAKAEQAKAGETHHMDQMEKSQTQAQAPDFSEIDQDGDGEAKISDIQSELQDQLAQTDWDEQKILDEFDRDQDQALNADEYETFTTVLAETTEQGAGQQAQMEQQEQQAQFEQREQQAQLGQQEQQEQQAQQEQEFGTEQQAQREEQEFEQQAQREEQEFEQQAQMEREEEQFQTEQQRDQQVRTEEDQQFQAGQQQEQQFETEQQQAQVGQAAQDMDQMLMSMPIDQVTGTEVVNSRGEQIGQVDRVVRDNQTGDLALVVRSGGILGLGGETTLVNLDEVAQASQDQLVWETTLGEDEIAEMPEFDDTQYSEISENEYATLEEARERG